jgi:hypothetical protein
MLVLNNGGRVGERESEKNRGERLSHCQKNRIIVKKNEKGKGEEKKEPEYALVYKLFEVNNNNRKNI